MSYGDPVLPGEELIIIMSRTSFRQKCGRKTSSNQYLRRSCRSPTVPEENLDGYTSDFDVECCLNVFFSELSSMDA